MRATAIATVAVASGALALSALAVPAVAADDVPDPALVIEKVVVNEGRPIVVGVKTDKIAMLAVTASHPSGIQGMIGSLRLAKKTGPGYKIIGSSEEEAPCYRASATTSTCELPLGIYPSNLRNEDATRWTAGAWVVSNKNTWNECDQCLTAVQLQRLGKLTVSAPPKPVKKGTPLTVTGKLTRANWDTKKYAGYAGQPVKLQFRKKGGAKYMTVKTVKGSGTGALKTTTPARTEGHWRWSFAGTETTSAVNTPGTLVKIKK
ncbi:calcium-binding protein [Streptomyces paludis]